MRIYLASMDQTTSKDMKIAALAGLLSEVTLAALNFKVSGELRGDHPWLQISQRPGADIAERLFGHVAHGLVPAIVCAALIQTIILAALILTAIQAGRLLAMRRHVR